jgi:peptide chain release factor 3
MRVFRPGEDARNADDDVIEGSTIRCWTSASARVRAAAQRDRTGAGRRARSSTIEAFLAGTQTPVFFGSAINNFGVQEVLDALVDLAPAAAAAPALQRMVAPDEAKFSGVVFKIQANMDPMHRDRIAFVRVCSGRFERGMKAAHLQRTGKEIRPNTACPSCRSGASCWTRPTPGDIIGIPNHGGCSSATR